MECQHPASMQHTDRVRGQVSCTLCGQVLSDQHFEIDPQFGRGQANTGALGSMRGAGFARPMRPSTAHGSHGLHRPSFEAARRQLTAIARKLSISPAQVDIANTVFQMTVSANAIKGARTSVLCACLYLVCRRQQHLTPLTVLDFSDVTGDSPFLIVSHLKLICKATSSSIPPIDPVFYVARLCQLINIPHEQLEPVAVYAMKVMRSMRGDWITIGRRPLGVAAAAVLVASQVHGIHVNIADLADLVRLHQFTIVLRVEEFAATPAAALNSIDEYDANEAGRHTAPPAFLRGRRTEGDVIRADTMRAITAEFYELVNEANEGAPATPERIAKWERFIEAKSRTSGLPKDQLSADLTLLSHAQQLEALGAVFQGPKKESTNAAAPLPHPADAATQAHALLTQHHELLSLNNLPDVTAAAEKPVEPSAVPAALRHSKGGPQQQNEPINYMVLHLGGPETNAEDEYIVYDNEIRLRSFKANEASYKDEWEKFGARFAVLLQRYHDTDGSNGSAQRQRRPAQPAAEPKSALESVQRVLRRGGGAHIDPTRLAELLPGIEDEFADLDPPTAATSSAAAQKRNQPSGAASSADLDDEWLIE